MPAAVSETAERAANAHQAEEHARKRRAAGFCCISRNSELSEAEGECITNDDHEQRHEARLCQRTEQRRTAARCDFPFAQSPRAQEKKHADKTAGGGKPDRDSRRRKCDEQR